MSWDAVREAAARLKPDVAVVLGSGLAGVVSGFREEAAAGFADVPGLVAPTVVGHGGSLAVGELAGRGVLLFRGRLHFYEGHPWERVERPIRLAAELGVRVLLLTNAAGGIRPDLGPGAVMALRDHLRWNRPWSWREPGPGARPSVYSPRLLELLAQVGVPAGVYGVVTGPSYETPAEIRALRAAGADAVGMSTAHEAEVAAALGMEVAAVSGITNHACGLGDGPLHHGEVLDVAKQMAGRMASLIEHVVRGA